MAPDNHEPRARNPMKYDEPTVDQADQEASRQVGKQVNIALSMLTVLYVLGFTNFFLRSSLGILAPALSSDMQLSPEALSIVASSFFFAYALMQIPSSMLLDRFGTRLTLAVLMLFTGAGTTLFAMAATASELITARILMGIGCAGIFSGAFFMSISTHMETSINCDFRY